MNLYPFIHGIQGVDAWGRESPRVATPAAIRPESARRGAAREAEITAEDEGERIRWPRRFAARIAERFRDRHVASAARETYTRQEDGRRATRDI